MRYKIKFKNPNFGNTSKIFEIQISSDSVLNAIRKLKKKIEPVKIEILETQEKINGKWV